MQLRDLALLILIVAIAAAATYSQGLNSKDIVGTWSNGGMSMLMERNTVTGSTTPSNGHTWTYEFKANGTFSFVGLLNSTVYGCTTGLFNEKSGRYELAGSTLTLTPNRNFWRKTNACAPGSNSERDYVLDTETFDVRTKTDDAGRGYICLTKGTAKDAVETCYHREVVKP